MSHQTLCQEAQDGCMGCMTCPSDAQEAVWECHREGKEALGETGWEKVEVGCWWEKCL